MSLTHTKLWIYKKKIKLRKRNTMNRASDVLKLFYMHKKGCYRSKKNYYKKNYYKKYYKIIIIMVKLFPNTVNSS